MIISIQTKPIFHIVVNCNTEPYMAKIL